MKCCELFAGKLRTKIKFETPSYASDGQGGQIATWSTYSTSPAFVKPISGTEKFYSMRLESNITHRIYIRYRDDITTSMQIALGTRKLQIKAIINIEERNKWLEIYAVEGEVT